jgi:hypothetical protein
VSKDQKKFRNFGGGLHLGGGADEIPASHVRRNRGIHPLSDKLFKSRNGSTQLHALNNVHSLIYYKDTWYSAASTLFYKEATQIKSGLSGDRLSFVKMPPTAGIEDHLFCAGGDELFKVGDAYYSSGTELITNGDMDLDANWANYGTPSTNERSTARTFQGTYSRKFTVDAANEGIQGDAFTNDAIKWYTVTAYVNPDDETDVRVRIRAGDDSGWAYNILHESLTQDAWNQITFTYQETAGGAGAYIVFEGDDATAGDWWIDEVSVQEGTTVTNWGTVPPSDAPAIATGGAGVLTGTYKYAATFRNSITGSRSDPIYTDDPDLSLLLHCDGADAATTFTDNGYFTHTVTAVANAQLDTAQKKFGTAAGLFDGTGDYISVPMHRSLSPDGEPFIIECWLRFPDVTTSKLHGIFSSIEATGARMRAWISISGGNATIVWDYFDGSIYQFTIQVSNYGITVDTWYHYAFVRGWGGDNSALVIAKDGTGIGSDYYGGNISLTAEMRFGNVSSNYLNGWMDEIRMMRGRSPYISTFTVPSVAYSSGSVAPVSEEVDLSAIPSSDDRQVDQLELWRTVAGGSDYFRLIALADGTATYTDNTPDVDLETIALPTDNTKPYSWFDDCIGPYNASVFWLARSQEGERGRLYYSPIGRTEAMQGFIEVCGDDEPLQKGVVWKGYIYLFGEGGIYQVYGTNPYYSRKIDPVGTTKPHTVAVTPHGICYEAEDGPRIFDGNRSQILKPDAVDLVFRGEAVENLTSFSGVVASFGRGEYTLSDESQTLSYHFAKGRWRDVGLGFKSLHYAKDADILGGGTAADGIYDIENEGDVQDNSTDIAIAWETEHHRIGGDAGGIVQFIHVDVDASSETLTVYLVHDGTATSLGTTATSSRGRATFQANRFCREFGVRITGSIGAAVNVYGIEADIYISMEEAA